MKFSIFIKKNLKKYFFLLVFVLIVLLGFSILTNNQKKFLGYWMDDNIWYRLDAIKRILIYDKKFADKFYNSYNQKYLPETLFFNLDYKTVKLEFLKQNKGSFNYSFFMEVIEENKVLITDNYGNFNLLDGIFKDNKIASNNVKNIKSNLEVYKALDSFLFQNTLYVSYINNNNGCVTFGIASAQFNTKYLDFKNFYTNADCRNDISGGKMQYYKFNNKEGLIFSLSAGIYNKPTGEEQKDDSNFGKILFQDFNSSEPIIFSKGHRVNQGLITIDNIILATEHGPKGGDEINKIEYNQNYGWPISSYGVKYGKNPNKPPYKFSHNKFGFKEPLYNFITAIGISEIIKLPNDFSIFWQDNFIISSLNRGSLYRVKFDKNYTKLLFAEEIYIGKRIRDLKYIKDEKKIILAVESRGELAILSRAN